MYGMPDMLKRTLGLCLLCPPLIFPCSVIWFHILILHLLGVKHEN